ncbi:MAG: hypothetical protein OK454_07940, partial [Thaumarchaeota archaeon]|nr:hypothetical protein [Nitrososphaerota archaeon]
RTAFEHMRELVGAKDERIAGLEMELERLRPGEDVQMADHPREDLDALTLEDLRAKYLKLEKDFESINKELPSIEKAYRKSVGLAQKKVMDFTALEERVNILILEKGKADQKYFAARKDTDIRTNEIIQLRRQNSKSADVIDQLKRAGEQSRTLLSNLEKQIIDLKQANAAFVEENKTFKTASADAVRRSEAIKGQLADLASLVKTKDTVSAAAKERAVAGETEVERLKVRLDHVQKDRDSWKTKCHSNSSEEEDMLRVRPPPPSGFSC